MTKNKLIQLVGIYLNKVGHGIDFDVLKEGVRQKESWWYLPVVATRNGKDVPHEVTVNIFANIEDELERNEDLSTLLIPAFSEAKETKPRNRCRNVDAKRKKALKRA